MSAAEALRAARAAGITLVLDGEALLLEAAAEPPQAVLDALARHKLAIVDLLRPRQRRWTAEQWRAYFEKRCGVTASNSGPWCAGGNAGAGILCDRMAGPAPRSVRAGTLRMVRKDGKPERRGGSIRDRAGNAYMASRRMLARLASGSEGRSNCGAAGNEHSSMRAQ
jgi:hypothetical protein